jgi:hypothetical protein
LLCRNIKQSACQTVAAYGCNKEKSRGLRKILFFGIFNLKNNAWQSRHNIVSTGCKVTKLFLTLECGGMTPPCLCRQHVAGYESDIVMSHSK